MKTTNRCPKCKSQEIVHVPNLAYSHNVVAISTFKAVPIARYICTDCGYCEDWVDSAEDRERLKARFSQNP